MIEKIGVLLVLIGLPVTSYSALYCPTKIEMTIRYTDGANKTTTSHYQTVDDRKCYPGPQTYGRLQVFKDGWSNLSSHGVPSDQSMPTVEGTLLPAFKTDGEEIGQYYSGWAKTSITSASNPMWGTMVRFDMNGGPHPEKLPYNPHPGGSRFYWYNGAWVSKVLYESPDDAETITASYTVRKFACYPGVACEKYNDTIKVTYTRQDLEAIELRLNPDVVECVGLRDCTATTTLNVRSNVHLPVALTVLSTDDVEVTNDNGEVITGRQYVTAAGTEKLHIRVAGREGSYTRNVTINASYL